MITDPGKQTPKTKTERNPNANTEKTPRVVSQEQAPKQRQLWRRPGPRGRPEGTPEAAWEMPVAHPWPETLDLGGRRSTG